MSGGREGRREPRTSELEERVARSIAHLGTNERDDAWVALLRTGAPAIPQLSAAYRREPDFSKRAELVELLWRTLSSEVVPLLAEALHDPSDLVFSEAVDGLVSIGGSTAIAALRDARTRAERDPARKQRVEWMDEALKQLLPGP